MIVYFCKRQSHFLREQGLHRIPKECFEEHKVKTGCELKEFMDGKFESGKVYYELTAKENIYEDKSLIFKVKNITVSMMMTSS